jgi:uncharacterized protein YhbP (UPF0306 family)
MSKERREMSDDRELLEEYIDEGKLMQLATRDNDGPWMCNVWYAHRFAPDRIYFISSVARHHSQQIRDDGAVAGTIMHEQLEQLGQKVRGVTFRGHATELPTEGIDEAIAHFLARWPTASGGIDAKLLAAGETPIRLYEISVREWVLFDEVNFPDQPRRDIVAR